jgi:type I restriction enzyme S subunit
MEVKELSAKYLAPPGYSCPEGYKQTEVGVIPANWEVAPLGALFGSLDAGVSVNSVEKDKDAFAHDESILKTSCVLGGKFLPEEHKQILPRDIHRAKVNPRKDSIIFSRMNTLALVGECGYVYHDYPNLFLPDRLWMTRADGRDASCARWLAYLLSFSSFNRAIKDTATGTSGSMKNISKGSLLSIHVPLPPLSEQEAIAKTLSDADALIEALEQLIAKKRHLKQGAMQELLTGKKRLPGFTGEWEVCQLRDCLLATPDYGINAPGVPSYGDLPVYIRITDIDDDGRFMADNRVAVNHPKAMDYILNENEIVFARTGGSVGKTYLYDLADGVIVFAGFLIRAKIDRSKLCPAFFAAFTRTGRYWNWVRIMCMRSGQPGISANEYASLDLHLPPLPEQTAIATILSNMDAEIAALQAKLAKTRSLKLGMMHNLLTGKIRLV